MKTSDIKKLGEAWLKVTSGESLEEAKKLDPVNDKENDKKFKDRKDKDIDNDGDVDSSDEYLHKRRKATDDAIDGGKKPAKNEGKRGFIKAAKDAKEKGEKDFVFAGKKYNVESALKEEEDENGDEPKKKKPFPPKKDGDEKDSEDEGEESEEDEEEEKETPKVAGKKDDKKKVASNAKTAEISKIGESFEEFFSALEEARKETKGATKPEEIDSKDSPKAKEFTAAHKGKSDKKIEDNEEDSHDKTFKAQGGTKPKSGKRPQDNQAGDTNIVKSTEAPVKGGEVKEEVELEEKFKVGDKVKVKKGSMKSPSQRHYEKTVGTIMKDYKDGDFKVNFGGNDDLSIDAKLLVKEEVELEEGAKVVDATTQEASVSLVDMARAQLAGEIKHPDEKNKKKLYDARTKEAKKFLERMAKRRG